MVPGRKNRSAITLSSLTRHQRRRLHAAERRLPTCLSHALSWFHWRTSGSSQNVSNSRHQPGSRFELQRISAAIVVRQPPWPVPCCLRLSPHPGERAVIDWAAADPGRAPEANLEDISPYLAHEIAGQREVANRLLAARPAPHLQAALRQVLRELDMLPTRVAESNLLQALGLPASHLRAIERAMRLGSAPGAALPGGTAA